MTTWKPRYLLGVLIGALFYFALLGLLYSIAPYATIPHWWREHIRPGPVALVSWFSLINISCAVLAALLVSIGLIIGSQPRAISLGMIIGFLAVMVIALMDFEEYGFPTQTREWVTEVIQLVSVGVAVWGVSAIFGSFPLTARWSRPGR